MKFDYQRSYSQFIQISFGRSSIFKIHKLGDVEKGLRERLDKIVPERWRHRIRFSIFYDKRLNYIEFSCRYDPLGAEDDTEMCKRWSECVLAEDGAD